MTTWLLNTDSDVVACTPSDGDTLLFATNTTFTATTQYNTILNKNNLTVGYTGTGDKPVISGHFIRSGAELTSEGSGIWSRTYGSSLSGNMLENGVLMKFKQWNGAWTTPSLIATGLGVGYYTIDYSTLKTYFMPTSGSVTGNTYEFSEVLTLFSGSGKSNLIIDALNITGFSRHGITLTNSRNMVLNNLEFNAIGGRADNASYSVGNGIELTDRTVGVYVGDCVFNDIFDSAGTTQLYGNYTFADNHVWHNLTINRAGMTGLEVSLQGAYTNQTIQNVTVENITANNIGAGYEYNFGGNRGGYATSVINNSGEKNKITNCLFSNVIANDCQLLIAVKNPFAINKFTNIYGDNVRNATAIVTSTSSSLQTHLYHNVTDNLGRTPIGIGNWQLTQGLALPTRTILSR